MVRIDGVERERAVEYLREQARAGLLQEVAALMADEESGWPAGEQFGIGLWVRNALRRGGFAWGDQTLDREWAGLIGEAAV